MLLTRRRVLAILLCLILPACSGTDAVGERESPTRETTAATAPLGPYSVPELRTTSLGGAEGDWDGLKAADGRLYAQERLTPETIRVVRFDPPTGEVVASSELSDTEGWSVTPTAVVVLYRDRRSVDLLDHQTLEVRHSVDLGEDARAGLTGDTPRSDEFWFGLRRRDVDQLQGIYTDMAVIRLDLETGQVVDRRDAPPCGGTSVAQLGDVLGTGIACAEQFATIDLSTNETTRYQSFPSGLSVLAFEDTFWVRWYDFGYLGRVHPGDEVIETLDLNADGPVLSRISPQMAGPRGIWVAGTPVEEGLGFLLNVVDTESFTVVARAWSPSPVAFIGDTGYVVADRRLATFDPASVTGGVPSETVRPATGPPEAIVPENDDERAVVEAFTKVFDASVPNEEVAVHLVDDPLVRDVRGRLLALAEELYPGVRARVTALAVGEDTASLAYVFILDDRLAFVPLTGSLHFDGETWRVTRDTVCRLAAQAAISEC